ncbi:hypothetical protein EGJ86_10355 [Pseudomonas sp. o96-267]|jgi:hypothetical protein|uniref:hypothetical protein n=1 Tax=Pseudomonas sp. o96-267 TaxID=2479853 RepID=UPI000F7A4DEC|nr:MULTISPECIES: hypothetical protein [Pseudomonas]MBG0848418.1 hypothetical protein [Pseudomonas chengduensis]RRV39825.1 hypothetical protein EGJ86_10355 [Pseudomonas sp. o96-267]TRO37660.1 hypothetical protein EQ832_12840 [Pseudomonas sp. ALS1131]
MSQHLTNSKEIQLGSIAVTVREMSVLQVRTWLAELLNPQPQRDLVDEALFTDCAIPDLLRMTSLTREQVDELRPSQLQEVIALCKELNPDFFAFMGRLVKPAAPTA